MPFIDTILPAPRAGGFRMDGYWVWCGSCIRGEDGRYHLFASRWPRRFPMHPGWTFHSEIVRAVADRPEGPYAFQEVVLPRRAPEFFDGRMTHNPTIHRWNGRYLLFYTGCTYVEEPPEPDVHPDHHDRYYAQVWCNKRIGVAVADSVLGPWRRPDAPILVPRSGKWDASITSNPAPCILPDGTVYLLYKSSALRGAYGGPFRLGLARAARWDAPYERVVDGPLFHFDGDASRHVEDPYLWHDGRRFNAVMKDMTGAICGEKHAGVHAVSDDAVRWAIAGKAWSREVLWDDGKRVRMGSFERPQLLLQDGVPTHLFAAAADGPGEFTNAGATWNMVLPLRGSTSQVPGPTSHVRA